MNHSTPEDEERTTRRVALNAIAYPVFGGPHNRAVRLNDALERRGWQTVVLLPDEPGNAAERVREGVVKVVQVRLHRLRANLDPRLHAKSVFGFIPTIVDIRRKIRNRNVQLVVVCGLANPHSAIAARLENLPVVWQITDSHTPSILRRLMMPIVGKCADAVMFNGQATLDLHAGGNAMELPSFVYYPPVDTRRFNDSHRSRLAARKRLDIPENAFVVGMVANLNPMKGIEYFIRAASIVYREVPHSRFLVVGAKYETHRTYNAKLEAELDASGIPRDRFIFTGGRPDVDEFYPAMDIKLITSVPRSEGTTTTAMEAMACGLPVVAADVGAVREAVEHGITGFVVPPLDPDAIASATLELLNRPELRKRMGTEGRKRAVEMFDAEVCADTHVRAFEAAIKHASLRRKNSRQEN